MLRSVNVSSSGFLASLKVSLLIKKTFVAPTAVSLFISHRNGWSARELEKGGWGVRNSRNESSMGHARIFHREERNRKWRITER